VKRPTRTPGNSEAEISLQRAIAGALIEALAFIPRVRSSLKPDDLFSAHVRTVYGELLATDDAGKPIDLPLVAAELQRHDVLEKIGGSSFVAELVNGVPADPSLLDGWVAKDRENAIKRRTAKFGKTLAESALNGLAPEQLAQMLQGAIEDLKPAQAQNWRDLLREFL